MRATKIVSCKNIFDASARGEIYAILRLYPYLSENEISDFGKVSIFVGWFVRRDRAVNTFIGKASNIFRNGIFPSFWDRKSLKNILSKYSDSKEWPIIGDWLIAKVFNDLNSPDKITVA